MDKKTSILLIDDHTVMRMGLASLLGTCRELSVVGDTGDGESGLRLAAKLHPDVIIMDLMMPRMNGADATKALIEKWPEAKILILTTFGTADGISKALEAGAKGAILKSADLSELRKAIFEVANGKSYISSEIRHIMDEDPPVNALSPRQGEILQAIARGFSNSDIAKLLGISLDMVREHTSALFQKLGAANRTEAVTIAIRKHLLKL